MEEANEGQIAPGKENSSHGALHLHELHSSIFRNSRMLRVWVPPGYDHLDSRERHYPVFYLNDGQNLFEPATSYTGVHWQVGETAERQILEGTIPAMILVGIDNAQKDRMKEYLPYRSLSPPIMRPQGKRFPEFLLNEVMPLIHQHYRIARGPENTGLGGSSLGALISLFTVLDRPGIFGRLLLESPSLFISNRRLLKYSRAFRQWPERNYLAIGTKESGRDVRDAEFVDDVRELEHIMRRSGLGENRLRIRIDEGASHSEGEWAKRFPDALTFLFGKQVRSETDTTKNTIK